MKSTFTVCAVILGCVAVVASSDTGSQPASQTVNFTFAGAGCSQPSPQDFRSYYKLGEGVLIPSVEGEGFVLTDIICTGSDSTCSIRINNTPIVELRTPTSSTEIAHLNTGFLLSAGSQINVVGNNITTTVTGYVLPTSCQSDINGSGTVDVGDLLELLADWGLCGAE